MKENKLIAEFMKLPTEVFKSGIMNYHHDGAWYEEHELSYEKSWDWLMKVVDKIKTKDLSREMVMQGIDELITEIDDSFDYNIATTYDAVVKFIEEYNKVKRNELQSL